MIMAIHLFILNDTKQQKQDCRRGRSFLSKFDVGNEQITTKRLLYSQKCRMDGSCILSEPLGRYGYPLLYGVKVSNKSLFGMRISYIYHSCYLLEFDKFSIVFDFYRDIRREDGSYWIQDYLLEQKGDLYVFVTHSHQDHFNPDIFSWKERKSNITYILSAELKQSGMAVPAEAILLDKLDTYKNRHLETKAFGSTDIGGSFLLNIGGMYYFHAGDLNNWHWNEEVPLWESRMYENNFLCELELIAEEVEELHVAMFPIDPRLGKDFMRGAKQVFSFGGLV